MKTVGDIAAGTQLHGSVDDAKTPLGSYLMAVGAEATDHAHVLCFTDEEEFGLLLTKWTVGDTPAAPALSAKAAAAGLAAQLVCPAERQMVVAALKEEEQRKHELENAVAVAAASAQSAQ